MQAKTTALALAATAGLLWTTFVPLAAADGGAQGSCPAAPCAEAPPTAARADLPHPLDVPAGTSCAACHAGPIDGSDVTFVGQPNAQEPQRWLLGSVPLRGVAWREVHAAQPADSSCTACHQNPHVAPPARVDALERLRARERELERLRGEVERLRRELEALRQSASSSSPKLDTGTFLRGWQLAPGSPSLQRPGGLTQGGAFAPSAPSAPPASVPVPSASPRGGWHVESRRGLFAISPRSPFAAPTAPGASGGLFTPSAPSSPSAPGAPSPTACRGACCAPAPGVPSAPTPVPILGDLPLLGGLFEAGSAPSAGLPSTRPAPPAMPTLGGLFEMRAATPPAPAPPQARLPH